MTPAKDSVADAVRVSHCAHPHKDMHSCVGTCTITPKGVLLTCSECGDGGDEFRKGPDYTRLTRILNVIGIDISLVGHHEVKSMLTQL